MTILNLTQHVATKEQIAAGVVDLAPNSRKQLQALLTISFGDDLNAKVDEILKLAAGFNFVMLGGAPYLMPLLEKKLADTGRTVMYAFSERVSQEFINDKGEVEKKMIFKHAGFYSAEEGWVE